MVPGYYWIRLFSTDQHMQPALFDGELWWVIGVSKGFSEVYEAGQPLLARGSTRLSILAAIGVTPTLSSGSDNDHPPSGAL